MKSSVHVKKGKRGETQIVIGAKIVKKAVERNLLRRRIRDILRGAEVEGYTVIVGKGAKELSFEELKKEIDRQL